MLFVLGGCEHRERVLVEGVELFRDGDMVFRCGYGAESRAVTEHSGAGYSHIGMLCFDSLLGEWMVLHAVPGESRPGEPEYLKRESITTFFASDRARRGAWMRVDCSDSIAALAARYCERKVAERVVFDNDYLLADTTQLYCCELVWRAYLAQGVDITCGERLGVPAFFCKEGESIFPSNIENSKTTLFVKHFKSVQL